MGIQKAQRHDFCLIKEFLTLFKDPVSSQTGINFLLLIVGPLIFFYCLVALNEHEVSKDSFSLFIVLFIFSCALLRLIVT